MKSLGGETYIWISLGKYGFFMNLHLRMPAKGIVVGTETHVYCIVVLGYKNKKLRPFLDEIKYKIA